MDRPSTPADVRARLGSLRADLLERVQNTVRFERREVIAIVVLVVLVVGGASLAYARARPAAADALAPIAQPTQDEQDAAAAAGRIVVHVVGAVRKPGVYDFADGARVIDAVEAAGGFAKKAARELINLARPLVDGEQLVIPNRGAAGTTPGQPMTGGVAGATGSTKVNINLASPAEFETLPGIGPVLAQRIVAYREQHGPFRSVQDLQKVSGIGPKIFESLEPVVTV